MSSSCPQSGKHDSWKLKQLILRKRWCISSLGGEFQIFIDKIVSAGRLFLFFLIFYLFIHERHNERGRVAKPQAEGEAGSMQAEVGLDPRAPGSCPEPKAGAQPLSHPGVPRLQVLICVLGAVFPIST